ncbi:ribonucleoside triphosphate reductase [Candidatus Woesearchaeota archaeon]|nr:ribonucleoside triphosphate reductase [Candidatus Woesearchaeota archaeon]
MDNKITKVRKRDGRIVQFKQEKITEAIFSAAQSVGGKDRELSEDLSNQATRILNERFNESEIPTVEDVQDIVEYVLVEEGHYTTAKAYILYRAKHKRAREFKNVFLDVNNTISEYIEKGHWDVNENSNEQYSFSGLLLYTSGKVIKNFALNYIYSDDIADAHEKGYMHIHDLSHAVVGYSFYRNESIIVRNKINKQILNLSMEQLYELTKSEVYKENGFEIKYTTEYEVLDENGWTDLKRVLRHKTNKSLLSFNTISGHNLIVTEDHPFITLSQDEKVVFCEHCLSKDVVKNRTNKNKRDYYKCKICNNTFKGPEKQPIDLSRRKEILAGDINLKNYAITPEYNLSVGFSEKNINSLDGWFIGMFIAEGYMKGNRISLELNKNTTECKKLIKYLQMYQIEHSVYTREHTIDGNQVLILEKESEKITIDINLNNLSSSLQEYISTIRDYSENKNMPTGFLNLSSSIVGSIVSGVIDGDGTVRNDDSWVSRVNIRLTSKTLLSQLQFWLKTQGIKSSLSSIDSYGERIYNGNKIISKKQLYSMTVYIPENRAELFKECTKIDQNFKYSNKIYKQKEYSSFRKIEYVENDSEYVYDITTESNTFLCNGILVHNCAGWSLKNLLKRGFGGVRNKVDAKPAKHMDVVVHQMVNYIGCLQMEWAGAQAFSSVDTFLAPFVKTDNLTYREVKQNMQKLIFSLNIPSRWGSQYPFSNLTFDWVAPVDLKEEKAIVGGEKQDFTYGNCQKEMDMINKAFLEVMLEGDANGRIFTFPIPTYNLTKEFNWESENAKELFKLTAKYGSPYFQNYIGSKLDPRSIRAMCCRLNLDMNELIKRPGGTFSMGDSTGSLGVVTINMNRIAYEAKSKQDFFNKLKKYMTLAKESLELKRKIVQRNMDNGLMPYTKVYLGTLRNHFSTIGLCGMNEACLNFLGKDIVSEKGKQFAIDTLNHMRGVLREFQVETGNLYNLEATPAESTAYRFGRLDKMLYPDIITAGEDVPYLSNSSQMPVNHTDDAIEALEHQNDIQPLYTGGTMFHTFLGQKVSSPKACMNMVKKIAENTRLPYFSITPTFSICPDHGYVQGEYFSCPEAISSGNKCGQRCEVYSRIVGYYRPVAQWNNGKKEEFKDRLEYSEERTMKSSFSNDKTEQENPLINKQINLSGIESQISSYRVFSLPNCDKCLSVKELLSVSSITGSDTSLKDDKGLKEFRSYYKEIKDKIKRNSDGSLPIPTVLFFDEKNKIVGTAHEPEQVKAILKS